MMTQSDIQAALVGFKDRVNNSPRARKLLTNWEPVVLVESTDGAERYFMNIKDSTISSVATEGDDEASHLVHVRGTAAELCAVFLGKKNAARAVLDTDLEVFASDKDQVKLDAISLVVWGV